MPRRKKRAALVDVGDGRRYRIVTGVPIPPAANAPNRYPLARMKIGQSFKFKEEEEGRLRNAIARYRAHAKSTKFTVRMDAKLKLGRIWRVT